VGTPGILKTARDGYDGKGQWRVGSVLEASGVRFPGVTCIYEGFIAYETEFSVILVRGQDGTIRFWDSTANLHDGGMLVQSILPAGALVEAQVPAARAIAAKVANALGYVEAGLCEVAQGWQVSVNPGSDFGEGFRFRSESVEALGGSKTFDRRDKPRVARGTIEYLPRDEALGRGFEMLRQADLDEPFLWFPQPDETQHWLRTAYVARLVDPGLIGHASFSRSRFPFAVEEVL
jgi:hypothetical protein